MALEKVEDVLSVLGYKAEDFTDASQLKAKVETEWFRRGSVPTEVKKQITGALVGSATDDLKKLSTSSGVEWDEKEVEKKPFEEVIKHVWNKREEKYKAEIDSLKEQVGQPNEAVSKLSKENEKLTAKLQAEAAKNEKLLGEFESFKTETASTLKNEKLGNQVSQVHATKVKLKSKITDLEKEGYWRKVEKSIRPELDDEGKLIVTDMAGNRLPGKAANSFKSYEEALEEIGIANNVWELNPHAKNQSPIIPINNKQEDQPPARNNRVIAKRIS